MNSGPTLQLNSTGPDVRRLQIVLVMMKLLDFSTFKNFRLTEKMSLQFRAEFFNFTNTPYLGAPGRRIDQANAGVISTARNPRNTQLGLKIVF